MKKGYLHTINGNPAFYIKGNGQICYAGHRIRLATSLKQIKEEQKATLIYRKKMRHTLIQSYGYRVVYLSV